MTLPNERLRELETRYDGPVPDAERDAVRRLAMTPRDHAVQAELTACRRTWAWQSVREAGHAVASAHRRSMRGEPGAHAEWLRARRWLGVELVAYAAERRRAGGTRTCTELR